VGQFFALTQIIRTHPSYWFCKGLDSLDANQGHFERRLSPSPGLLSLVSAGAEVLLSGQSTRKELRAGGRWLPGNNPDAASSTRAAQSPGGCG